MIHHCALRDVLLVAASINLIHIDPYSLPHHIKIEACYFDLGSPTKHRKGFRSVQTE